MLKIGDAYEWCYTLDDGTESRIVTGFPSPLCNTLWRSKTRIVLGLYSVYHLFSLQLYMKS